MTEESCLRLSFGTGLERSTSESLIGPLYAFVHDKIWLRRTHALLDSQGYRIRIANLLAQTLTARAELSQSVPHRFFRLALDAATGHSVVLYQNVTPGASALK
jgi:hypothetical protein